MAAKRISKRAKPGAGSARSADDVVAQVTATGLVAEVYRLSRAAIHGPGDYAAIAAALRELAAPTFPLVEIADAVDLAAKEASLELSLDGVYHVLDAEVRGAAVDEGVLVMLGALFEQRQKAAPAVRRWLLVDATTCKAARTYLFTCATLEATSAINQAAETAFVKLTEL
jgi:hypothetical protein